MPLYIYNSRITSIVTTNEPDDSGDNTPEDNREENEVFHTQGVVATTDLGEHNNTGEERGTNKPIQMNPGSTIHSGSIVEPVKFCLFLTTTYL